MRFLAEARGLLFCTAPRLALTSTQPPIQWVPEAPSPGIKRPQCEGDQATQSRTNVSNVWHHTSILPTCHQRVLRDFIFAFIQKSC